MQGRPGPRRLRTGERCNWGPQAGGRTASSRPPPSRPREPSPFFSRPSPKTPQFWGRWLPPWAARRGRMRLRPRFLPSGAAPREGEGVWCVWGFPLPTQPLGWGGGDAAPPPPGRALRHGEGPLPPPPLRLFPPRSPHRFPPSPPGAKWTRLPLAPVCGPERTIASRGGGGRTKGRGQFHRLKEGGSNLPPPHGGMGAGGKKGGERIRRLKFKGERKGPREGEGKEGRDAAEHSGAAGRDTAGTSRPHPPLSPGMKAGEEEEEAEGGGGEA